VKYFPIERKENENNGSHYCYLAQKNSDADSKAKLNWADVEKFLILEEEKEKLLENKFKTKDTDSSDNEPESEEKDIPHITNEIPSSTGENEMKLITEKF